MLLVFVFSLFIVCFAFVLTRFSCFFFTVPSHFMFRICFKNLKAHKTNHTYPFTGREQIHSQYVSNNIVTCVFGLDKLVANILPNVATFKISPIKYQKMFFPFFIFFSSCCCCDYVCCMSVYVIRSHIFSYVVISISRWPRRLLAC